MSKPSKLVYIGRLFAFLIVAALVGLVVLVCLFAPATNPGFLTGVLYRGREVKDLEDMANTARLLMGADCPSVAMFKTLAQPVSEDQYQKLGIAKPEAVKFKTSDGVELDGLYFPGKGEDTALVCYNGFGMRLPIISGFIKVLGDAGLSVLLFDYRGRNDKKISFSPQTACLDGQAAYDYLIKERGLAPEHLIMVGRELGSHVCLKLAGTNKCKMLLLEEPWVDVKKFLDKVPAAAAMQLVPQSMYTDDCLNNLHLVGHDHPPILVISEEPEITGAREFFTAISSPKAYLAVEGMPPLMLCPDFKVDGARYTRRLSQALAGDRIDEPTVSTVKWKQDYPASLAEAQKSGKLLLVEFGASWCGPCRKMDEITYSDAEVIERLSTEFIPVKLDLKTKQAKDLSAKYKFSGIPTALILDGQGNLKEKLTGFMGPERFLKALSSTPSGSRN